jgi:hypothetical protein
MTAGMRTMTIATIVANIMMFRVALAQPHDDHHDHDRHDVKIIEVGVPNRGIAGTAVKIRGEHLEHASVIVGGQHIAPIGANDHELTFAMPALPVGMHKIQVEVDHHTTDAGSFEMLPPNGNPGPIPPDMGHHDHEWKLDRPVIYGWSPAKGEPGETITIRGRNLGELQVVWGDQVVPGAAVHDGDIVFKIPRGAASGVVSLRGGKLHHDLSVGTIEVAKYDRGEWKRHDDERRAAAEAAWRERAASIAKDRAARDAYLQKQEQELAASREQRRRAYLAEVAAKFQRAFLADPETQSELTLHAQRAADLARMQRLADDLNDQKLGVRIEVATRKENERHDNRMAALKAAFKG